MTHIHVLARIRRVRLGKPATSPAPDDLARSGDGTQGRSGAAEVAARLWSRVDRSGGPDACWLWTGSRSARGYGRIAYDGVHSKAAHRLALRLSGVEVPRDSVVIHSCDNPPCCNPAHLRVGTQAENIREMFDRDRQPSHMRRATHCQRGHLLAGDNLRPSGYRPNGERRFQCRTCVRVTARLRSSGGGSTTRTSAPSLGVGPGWTSRQMRRDKAISGVATGK